MDLLYLKPSKKEKKNHSCVAVLIQRSQETYWILLVWLSDFKGIVPHFGKRLYLKSDKTDNILIFIQKKK